MIFIRFFPHATTFDNEAGIATGSVEVSLSPLGRAQVLNLREVVRKDDFAAVFSSNLKRAQDTAEGALGDRYDIQLDSRIREIDIGEMTGRPDAEVNKVLTEFEQVPFPEGESLRNVEERVRGFLSEKESEFQGQKIAIFAHRMPQLALEVITKQLSWSEALSSDWRNTKSFQYGWNYVFKG